MQWAQEDMLHIIINNLGLLGVYSVQSMGLGGGFLLTHFDAKSGLVEALDAREAAPRASHEGMFQ